MSLLVPTYNGSSLHSGHDCIKYHTHTNTHTHIYIYILDDELQSNLTLKSRPSDRQIEFQADQHFGAR